MRDDVVVPNSTSSAATLRQLAAVLLCRIALKHGLGLETLFNKLLRIETMSTDFQNSVRVVVVYTYYRDG